LVKEYFDELYLMVLDSVLTERELIETTAELLYLVEWMIFAWWNIDDIDRKNK
jgi:hypothetical protein